MDLLSFLPMAVILKAVLCEGREPSLLQDASHCCKYAQLKVSKATKKPSIQQPSRERTHAGVFLFRDFSAGGR